MRSRIIASLLILFSSILLILDKLIVVEFTNNYGLADSATLLWVVTQSIAPILICFASAFKPFRIAYIVPIYLYTLQLFWMFSSSDPKSDDRDFMYIYCLGSVVLFVLIIILFNKFFKKQNDLKKRVSVLEALLDLSDEIYE